MSAADPVILATLVISGLLAMIRGFTLELLGLIALVAAALIALLGLPEIHHWLKDSLPEEPLGTIIVIGGLFAVALIPLWVIGHFVGRSVRDSNVGALDRAAGFGFGVLRGLFLLAVAYLILMGFGGAEVKEPDWIKDAQLMPLVRATADLLKALISEDSFLGKRLADSLLIAPVLVMRPGGRGTAPR
jgi:membrane protein required for colicin V production